MTMLRKNFGEIGGDQKYFMYFFQPADVKDMTFMVYKYHGKDADRWLFVPSISMVRRIAAKDKHSSFVGSDFTYEDVSGRNLQEDAHSIVKEEKSPAARIVTSLRALRKLRIWNTATKCHGLTKPHSFRSKRNTTTKKASYIKYLLLWKSKTLRASQPYQEEHEESSEQPYHGGVIFKNRLQHRH